MERVPCSPAEIATNVVSLMRVQADRKGVALDVDFSGRIPATIKSDPTRLRQILTNLVGNAIKFTERGHVLVRTAMATRPDVDEPRLKFDVCDTGIGLSSEQIGRFFEPFAQADASTTRKFGGTGLGLTISRRLARALGGDITIESEPDQGSTFRVTIATGPPAGVTLLEPSEAKVASKRSASVPGNESTGMKGRILLAEDGPDNQRLISTILARAGADVTIAENGKEAVERALAETFDLILMDIQMPELDGYAATRQLRQQGITCPVIALTANAMASDRQKCLDAGCDDFVTKPIDRAGLITLLSNYLESAGQRRPAGPDES